MNTDDINDTLTGKMPGIELRAAGKVIDRIESAILNDIADGGARHREIAHEFERRGPDTEAIDVVYIVTDWVDGEGPGNISGFSTVRVPLPGAAIPIRFPRSVKVSTDKDDTATRTRQVKGMRPYPPSGAAGQAASFRAFARVADLNQVLCPTREDYAGLQPGEDGFWPWVPRVAKINTAGATVIAEEKLKFNWNDNEPTPGTYSRMNAANVFCVGGPWLDGLDNDGDGYADEDGGDAMMADQGKGPDASGVPGGSRDGKGRFGGPELRVAGKINLNTATEDTLRAMAESYGMPEDLLKNWVVTFRDQRAIRTPWQFVKPHSNVMDAVPGDRSDVAKGPIEQRDLPYTLISNVASVRGDTFSIYGTIEYGLIQGTPPPPGTEFQVVRRRRFWALVDRSPCLAYPPGQRGGDDDFIRPRILNFQWLD